MGDGILFIYHAQAGPGDIFQFCNLFLISGIESESLCQSKKERSCLTSKRRKTICQKINFRCG